MEEEFKTMMKEYAEEIKAGLKQYFSIIKEEKNITPSLCIIQVGDNPASNAYVKGKLNDGKELGAEVVLKKFDENIKKEDLIQEIKLLNNNNNCHGIIIQLPLPKHLNEEEILSYVTPLKDVDGFSEKSPCYPCTPFGIILFLKRLNIKLDGMNTLIIGRSNIVGKPMAKMLLANNANVTICHSHTKKEDLINYVANADLIISATGKQGILNKTFKYKPYALVIDVGINRGEDGKLHGDCEPDLPVFYQSPVPGGVGLLTRAALYMNLSILIGKN